MFKPIGAYSTFGKGRTMAYVMSIGQVEELIGKFIVIYTKGGHDFIGTVSEKSRENDFQTVVLDPSIGDMGNVEILIKRHWVAVFSLIPTVCDPIKTR